jgi:GxxExxY protein
MTHEALLERETTHHVIGAFFEVYKTLGFGFLEHVYREALERELVERARRVQKEVLVAVWYKAAVISSQRVDLLVDDKVVVEIKSTELLAPAASRQLLNYLRATSYEVGLLLHFGPKPRFSRMVHSQKPSSVQVDGDRLFG